MREFRFLDETRKTNGLTPAEEQRWYELAQGLGVDAGQAQPLAPAQGYYAEDGNWYPYPEGYDPVTGQYGALPPAEEQFAGYAPAPVPSQPQQWYPPQQQQPQGYYGQDGNWYAYPPGYDPQTGQYYQGYAPQQPGYPPPGAQWGAPGPSAPGWNTQSQPQPVFDPSTGQWAYPGYAPEPAPVYPPQQQAWPAQPAMSEPAGEQSLPVSEVSYAEAPAEQSMRAPPASAPRFGEEGPLEVSSDDVMEVADEEVVPVASAPVAGMTSSPSESGAGQLDLLRSALSFEDDLGAAQNSSAAGELGVPDEGETRAGPIGAFQPLPADARFKDALTDEMPTRVGPIAPPLSADEMASAKAATTKALLAKAAEAEELGEIPTRVYPATSRKTPAPAKTESSVLSKAPGGSGVFEPAFSEPAASAGPPAESPLSGFGWAQHAGGSGDSADAFGSSDFAAGPEAATSNAQLGDFGTADFSAASSPPGFAAAPTARQGDFASTDFEATPHASKGSSDFESSPFAPQGAGPGESMSDPASPDLSASPGESKSSFTEPPSAFASPDFGASPSAGESDFDSSDSGLMADAPTGRIDVRLRSASTSESGSSAASPPLAEADNTTVTQAFEPSAATTLVPAFDSGKAATPVMPAFPRPQPATHIDAAHQPLALGDSSPVAPTGAFDVNTANSEASLDDLPATDAHAARSLSDTDPELGNIAKTLRASLETAAGASALPSLYEAPALTQQVARPAFEGSPAPRPVPFPELKPFSALDALAISPDMPIEADLPLLDGIAASPPSTAVAPSTPAPAVDVSGLASLGIPLAGASRTSGVRSSDSGVKSSPSGFKDWSSVPIVESPPDAIEAHSARALIDDAPIPVEAPIDLSGNVDERPELVDPAHFFHPVAEASGVELAPEPAPDTGAFEIDNSSLASIANNVTDAPALEPANEGDDQLELATNADFLTTPALTSTGEGWAPTRASVALGDPSVEDDSEIIQGVVLEDDSSPQPAAPPAQPSTELTWDAGPTRPSPPPMQFGKLPLAPAAPSIPLPAIAAPPTPVTAAPPPMQFGKLPLAPAAPSIPLSAIAAPPTPVPAAPPPAVSYPPLQTRVATPIAAPPAPAAPTSALPVPAAPPGDPFDRSGLALGGTEPVEILVAGEHRVILHTVEGQVKRGVIRNVNLGAEVITLDGSSVENLPRVRVKAVFFMLAPGARAPVGEGDKVRVTFKDGRQVAGFSKDQRDATMGFFVVPADNRTNTERIFIYRHAVQTVSIE